MTRPIPPRTGGKAATLRHGLVLLAAAYAPLYIYAQTPPPLLPPSDACGPQASQHTLEQLLANVAQCQHQPDWLTHLGERLNTQGQYAEAAEHLERALLLAPHHLGAAFAYAVALAGTGDFASAAQLLAQASTRANLPTNQRNQLLTTQQRMAQAQTTHPTSNHWYTQPSASLRWGHDSNLLGSPRISSLTLSLPDGDMTLPLENSSQPSPGSFLRTDLRLSATHSPNPTRNLNITLALQHRHTPTLTSATTTQTEAQIQTQPTGTPGGWASTSFVNLHTQGGTRYHSTALSGGWAWITPGCQPRLGIEWQQRQLASNPVLSGRYTGLNASWACNSQATLARPAWQPAQWGIYLRSGQDLPTHSSRPGGTQRTTAMRTTLHWPRWMAEAELIHTQDGAGYSPLLANNRVRHSTRALLRIEAWQPLPQWAPGLQAHWGLELDRQQSNLTLFSVTGSSVYAGLRKQW